MTEPLTLLQVLMPADKSRTGSKRYWTTKEERTLREVYPRDGLAAAVRALPGRSAAAVHQRAAGMGLVLPPSSLRREINAAGRWRPTPSSPQIDQAIREAWPDPTSEAINAIGRRFLRRRAWVLQRAGQLGLVYPQQRHRWTDGEDAVIQENAHRKPRIIQAKLRAKGFPPRTALAIDSRRRALGASKEDPDHYTAQGLASLFGVSPRVVSDWIGKGWLEAGKRGVERTDPASTPDHWWIKRAAVKLFVQENVGAVDFHKVDKFWLVELLTTGRQV